MKLTFEEQQKNLMLCFILNYLSDALFILFLSILYSCLLKISSLKQL